MGELHICHPRDVVWWQIGQKEGLDPEKEKKGKVEPKGGLGTCHVGGQT